MAQLLHQAGNQLQSSMQSLMLFMTPHTHTAQSPSLTTTPHTHAHIRKTNPSRTTYRRTLTCTLSEFCNGASAGDTETTPSFPTEHRTSPSAAVPVTSACCQVPSFPITHTFVPGACAAATKLVVGAMFVWT